ncbi:uncharacterized protein HMPREF1541_09477 [Cyphellophora europaea CBS 101466]|uniref:Uncharacterized protein n=1 Tax=Cyphellophora europaea (strain CBS 101466) TaxID=1220924 RepID=W2SAI1_CYPE1|nr:uncharacterized protein HMPREF1541_09477 [Cyphellophora europaea CBS 101466]ETN45645.1 hypothetical protein HMPREF1541_09477 [Cyphellophora europaea CBS 101466]
MELKHVRGEDAILAEPVVDRSQISSNPELKILQQTQSTLIETIHKLYFMVRTAQPWTFGTPKEDSNGTPVIEDIVRRVQHAQTEMAHSRAQDTPIATEFEAADPCHDFKEYAMTAQQELWQLNHGLSTMMPANNSTLSSTGWTWDQTFDKTHLSSINFPHDFLLQQDSQSTSTAKNLNSNTQLQEFMTLNEPFTKMNMNTGETVPGMIQPSENWASISHSNGQNLFGGRSSEYIEGLLRGLNEFNELAKSVGLCRS